MRTLTVAAAVALMFSVTALGQATIAYTLELGGDNHVGDWEGFSNTAFTAGTAGNVVYDCSALNNCDDLVVTWDAKVTVTGMLSGTSNETNGATNLVFDLELTGGSNPDDVVFFSTINDGDADGLRGVIQGTDPLELASFCLGFNVNGNGPPAGTGRVRDVVAEGGPAMTRAQFPSSGAHGGGRYVGGTYTAGGTPVGVADSELIGMGCGYPQFNPFNNGGEHVAGVGIDTFGYGTGTACERGLGIVPVFEGQIDLSGLENGVYTLTLTPGAGNNVMPGLFDCQYGAVGAFAVAADVATGGSLTITIQNKTGGCDPVSPIAWRSVRDHNGTDLSITLDASATLSGDATTESRRDGVEKIEVDFAGDVSACYTGGTVSATGGLSVDSHQLINGGTTLEILVSGSVNHSCYLIDISGAFSAGATDGDCYVAAQEGDANNDQNSNFIDLSLVKSLAGNPASTNPRADYNVDGNINFIDVSAIKSLAGSSVVCP